MANPNRILMRRQRAASILRRLPVDQRMIGAEIGVASGALSAILLRRRPLLTLTMVDLWAQNPSPDYAATHDVHATLPAGRFRRMHALAQRSTRFAAERRVMVQADSVDGSKTIPDQSLDFAFIDDDHSKSGCERSVKAWYPKIKSGGWIGGHDYNNPGTANRPLAFGVTEAVNEFFGSLGLAVALDGDFTWFVRKDGS